MVEEVRRVHHKSECVMRMKEGRKENESKRSERRPKARQTLGKFGKWLFYPVDSGTELAVCQMVSDGKDAGSASEREQMGRGDSTKVETAKRRRQS